MRLRTGMAGKQILAELKGNTNGETRQATSIFLERCEVEPNGPGVVNANDEYALVYCPEYYGTNVAALEGYVLLGLTDEEKYFVRPIDEMQYARVGLYEIGNVLDWLNRADQGFGERLQGDLLYQFIPRKRECQARWVPDRVHRLIHRAGLLHCVYEIKLQDCIPFELRLDSASARWLSLGNHKVIPTSGAVMHTFGPGFEMLAIDAKSVEVMHPEHKTVYKEIPAAHLMIITQQRGTQGRGD